MNNIKQNTELPLKLLFVGQNLAPPNCIFERKNYEYLLVEYVLSGQGFVEIDGQHHICHDDSIYLLPPGLDHRYGSFSEDPWNKEFFIFEGDLVKHFIQDYQLIGKYVFKDCAELRHYFRDFDVLQNQPNVNWEAPLLLHRFFQDVFVKYYHKDKRKIHSPQVARLKTELDLNLEHKVSLDELAEKLGCSKVYMIRIFKHEMGVSPYEYLMNRRIESARILLTHSTLFIKEIAEQLCFSDQYHFSNYFKKKVGLSPQHFRSK